MRFYDALLAIFANKVLNIKQNDKWLSHEVAIHDALVTGRAIMRARAVPSA